MKCKICQKNHATKFGACSQCLPHVATDAKKIFAWDMRAPKDKDGNPLRRWRL